MFLTIVIKPCTLPTSSRMSAQHGKNTFTLFLRPLPSKPSCCQGNHAIANVCLSEAIYVEGQANWYVKATKLMHQLVMIYMISSIDWKRYCLQKRIICLFIYLFLFLQSVKVVNINLQSEDLFLLQSIFVLCVLCWCK